MNQQAFEEFKKYALFSVRVDRYFNIVGAYGLHHQGLRTVYDELPPPERLKEVLSSPERADDIKRFLVIAANRLNYISTINIFSNSADEPEGEARQDALNVMLTDRERYYLQEELRDFLEHGGRTSSTQFRSIGGRKLVDQPISSRSGGSRWTIQALEPFLSIARGAALPLR